MVRLGAIDSPPKTPAILGFECAGEVEAVGEGVEDFKVGLVCSLRECSRTDKKQ
jgi:NADPH:quinone reductase-like Zn-dependent oxidoreductase